MKSQYICECGNLLYVDLKSRAEVCLNKVCKNSVSGRIKDDPNIIYEKFDKIEKNLQIEIARFSTSEFLKYLLHLREELIFNFLNLKYVEREKFYTLDELLVYSKNVPRKKTRISSSKKFDMLIKKYQKLVFDKNFVDDILNQRIVITDETTLRLKYWYVLFQQYSNYGITDQKTINAGGAFKYTDIDSAANLGKEFEYGKDDFVHFFKKLFPFMLSLRYMLQYNYRLSKLYKYDYDKRDIAYLLSIFLSLQHQEGTWKRKNFMNHLKRNHDDGERISKFLSEFSTGKDKVPLFIDNGDEFIFTKSALMFYMCYLMGGIGGMIQEGKVKASDVFVEKIADIMRNRGYKTETEFELYKKAEWEYDVIAFHKELKKVILIEAKYRDVSPSSISGKTLIDQELEGDEGLKQFTEDQKGRIEHFKNKIEEFGKKLDCDFKEYDIDGFVVTKYIPLIEENNGIRLMGFDEFINKGGNLEND